MLNRIRNAQAVHKNTVIVPWSFLKYKIAKLLEREGFIELAESKGRRPKKVIKIILKYHKQGTLPSRERPAFTHFKRISKPGQRIYASYKELNSYIKRGGIGIISTSKGLMTHKEAIKNKVGGEVLCEVW